MKIAFILSLLFISGNSFADCSKKQGAAKERCECFEKLPEVENSERACSSDADCELIADTCGSWAAFNKTSVDKYKKLFEKPLYPTKVNIKKMSTKCLKTVCRVSQTNSK